MTRRAREDGEELSLAPGATRSSGAGRRAVPEEPDPLRTCFERDHDRILHSSAFRRLAGKTQVFVFPRDHQRTRLTHALEVAQVATAVARATGLNLALTEAIALGHDCGHGPGGHASEEAFAPYLADGYNHAIWGADVVLAPLNLCAETLDGIRHHSWSLPSPATPEGAVVSWADRCAYCAHDLEDAAGIGIVDLDDLPATVVEVAGRSRSSQLRCFITALVDCITTTGEIGMRPPVANALAALRAFNYERILYPSQLDCPGPGGDRRVERPGRVLRRKPGKAGGTRPAPRRRSRRGYGRRARGSPAPLHCLRERDDGPFRLRHRRRAPGVARRQAPSQRRRLTPWASVTTRHLGAGFQVLQPQRSMALGPGPAHLAGEHRSQGGRVGHGHADMADHYDDKEDRHHVVHEGGTCPP